MFLQAVRGEKIWAFVGKRRSHRTVYGKSDIVELSIRVIDGKILSLPIDEVLHSEDETALSETIMSSHAIGCLLSDSANSTK